MSDDQFSPQEQALIERLRNAPQATLSPDKMTAIRGQMLAAVDARLSPSTTLVNGKYVIITTFLAIVIVVIAFVILGLPSQNETSETVSTATAVPTNTIQSETMTPTVEATLTVIVETPPLQPTETVNPVVVIEGPITEISADSITVFGIVVQVNDVSILSDLQIGDTVRVDGQTVITDETVIINAITIISVNIEETGGSSTGGTIHLPPNCKRTDKGKITCK